jgi:hypothetical protein
MNRKDELLTAVNNDIVLTPLVYEMCHLEAQLDMLRELPKIKVNPKDPTKQKATPAAKLYKEYLQQYTNVVKILIKATGTDESDEESPLRKWIKNHVDKN